MTVPTNHVYIAFATAPDDPSPAWIEVTPDIRMPNTGISLTHGRQDQFSAAQPARLNFTLMNEDGRYTPGNAASPYYPNVKKGRMVRWDQTHLGVTYHRFTGYIDEWPIDWDDATGNMADAAVSATARTARLGHGKALPSIVEVEYLLDSPDAYYTLGEGSGSIQAGNTSAVVQPPMAITPFGGGSTANAVFGNTPGPPTDGTAVSFTRVSATAGAYLAASLNGFTSGSDPSIMLEVWFNTNQTQEMGLAALDAPDAAGMYLKLGVNATGKLYATYATPESGALYTATSAATVTDGAWHHAAIRHTVGGFSTGTLFLDGASVATGSATASQRNLTRLVAGGGINTTSAYVGALAHIAAYTGTAIPDARVQQHYLAGSTGFAGERSDQRIQRLATYAGMALTDVTVETGLSTSVAAQDTTGAQPVTLMQDVTATEGGILFDAGDGKLTFHARSHRYNAASTLTLLVGRREIMPGISPRLDDQDLVNDVTASRAGGVSARVVDAASVAEYGTYHEDIQLLTTDDNEVFDAASWKVFTSSVPQVKVPTLPVELANLSPEQTAVLLARQIGDRMTIGQLPAQAPAPTMDFFIEGWTQTATDFSDLIVFNLSAASLSGVWQLDSPTYSVLGTTTRLAY